MAYRPLYPWYIDPLTHGISTPLPMVFWPPIHGILTPLPMVHQSPYPWYFDPPYLWYIESPIHGILTPIPMVFWSLSMVYWPPTHGILTPYPWYIDPLSMVYQPLSFGRNEGVNLPWEGSKYNDEKSTRGQYIIWKLTMGSIYNGGQNIIWHWAWWISVPNHDNIFIWTF